MLTKRFLLITATLLAVLASIDAAGGRGGGGGGRSGGGGRGRGSAISHTPSMSRGGGGGKRINSQMSRARTNQYLKQRGQNFKPNRNQNFRNNFRNSQRNYVGRARMNQAYWRNNRSNYRGWFNNNFFVRHNYRPGYWNSNVNWWRPYGWAGVAGWLGYSGVGYPVYYYGEDGTVELDGSDLQDQYQNQAALEQSNTYIPVVSGVNAPPAGNPDVQGEWLPLGVFALGRNEFDINQSNIIIQLALNKNGEIAGTYYNSATDVTRELDGEVDKQTQQAAWRLSDKEDSPIVSTGLYNLTLGETHVTLTFPDGTEQNWLMMRLQE